MGRHITIKLLKSISFVHQTRFSSVKMRVTMSMIAMALVAVTTSMSSNMVIDAKSLRQENTEASALTFDMQAFIGEIGAAVNNYMAINNNMAADSTYDPTAEDQDQTVQGNKRAFANQNNNMAADSTYDPTAEDQDQTVQGTNDAALENFVNGPWK